MVAAIVKMNIAETTQHQIVFDEMLQRCWSLRWLAEEKLHVGPHFFLGHSEHGPWGRLLSVARVSAVASTFIRADISLPNPSPSSSTRTPDEFQQPGSEAETSNDMLWPSMVR